MGFLAEHALPKFDSEVQGKGAMAGARSIQRQ